MFASSCFLKDMTKVFQNTSNMYIFTVLLVKGLEPALHACGKALEKKYM